MWVTQAFFNASSCWRAHSLDLLSRINHLIMAFAACLLGYRGKGGFEANDIPSNIQISITRYAVQAQGHMVREDSELRT